MAQSCGSLCGIGESSNTRWQEGVRVGYEGPCVFTSCGRTGGQMQMLTGGGGCGCAVSRFSLVNLVNLVNLSPMEVRRNCCCARAVARKASAAPLGVRHRRQGSNAST